MEDMFGVGSLAFVISTNNLFIKSLKGWISIPTESKSGLLGKLTTDSNEIASGPTVIELTKKQITEPTDVDKKLIKETLIVPQPGIMAKRPYLMLIALNEPYSGRMGGLAKIDKMCSTQAKAAGYFGLKFHTLISDNYNDIANMIPFRSRKKPVANTRGEQIFARAEDIYKSDNYTAFNPNIPIYSFDQKDVRQDPSWPVKKFWHGSHANGKLHSTKMNCRNWRSEQPFHKATASSILTYTPALNELDVRCDQKLIVLCLQVR
ncbi:collagen alpha-1(XV) chain-like [Clytia hemisphaerica]|uniref:Collagenase NC10/endostatin domain-containing protein n=1 Tax=Clytia hemisphaerica TaxID=252671 RepID=A0A7M5WM51_9CNID